MDESFKNERKIWSGCGFTGPAHLNWAVCSPWIKCVENTPWCMTAGLKLTHMDGFVSNTDSKHSCAFIWATRWGHCQHSEVAQKYHLLNVYFGYLIFSLIMSSLHLQQILLSSQTRKILCDYSVVLQPFQRFDAVICMSQFSVSLLQ